MIDQKEEIIRFLKNLREQIILSFESLEDSSKFERSLWDYQKGSGGGEIAELRSEVFERAAVNFSAISGDHFPMQDGSGPFFATGVSLITHLANPHAPTAHLNLRFIQAGGSHWFAGGYDLTPMGFVYDEDTEHFHGVARRVLDRHSTHLYPKFSKNAKEYFYIPHRKKERGVGGIFFDHYNTGNFEKDFSLWNEIGSTFINAIMPIYGRRIFQPFSDEEKELQLRLRAHYVEFNLLYDRGTKFGFLSGGNPDAILSSLPPLVKW